MHSLGLEWLRFHVKQPIALKSWNAEACSSTTLEAVGSLKSTRGSMLHGIIGDMTLFTVMPKKRETKHDTD